jgi:hypothetical protein
MARNQSPKPGLDLQLLRKGVTARAAGTKRCHDCGRTPLIGERVYTYARARLVCELCRLLRSDEPIGCERLRGTEHGHAVRLKARAA